VRYIISESITIARMVVEGQQSEGMTGSRLERNRFA
jgi:hypothetical protein